MSKFAVVKENNKLIRDMDSKAILNTDLGALNEHRKKKKMMEGILENHKKIDKLETDVQIIKEMLTQLLKDKV